MKKNTVVHVVVMVVALAVASVIACKLNVEQKTLCPEKKNMTSAPVGGLHKFAADVEWMLFINYMGSQSTVDDSNIDEVTARLERLIALDPNLAKVYQEGVSFLSVADPDKTIELLEKACNNPQLKNNAAIPFYTGFVMVQFKKNPDYRKAMTFFKKATECSEGPQEMRPQYWSYYFRAKAKLLAAEKKIDERMALAEVLYNEYKKDRNNGMGEGSADLKNRLFNALRAVRNASEDYTPAKSAIDRATAISKKVFSDSHLCGNCMTEYEAGDAFCRNCGTSVKSWGKCVKCAAVVGGKAFCTSCGTKASK